MKDKTQGRPRYVVGMDAHPRKLAISVWDGTDPWAPERYGGVRCFDIGALEKAYERHVPEDSVTLIEASTNAGFIKRRLADLGYRAEAIRADAVSGEERRRRVCDARDAENIALAYIHGDVKEFVWTPGDECAECRELLSAYRDCVKEPTRTANRIWALCSRKGLSPDIRGGVTGADAVRGMVEGAGTGGFTRRRLDMLARGYAALMGRRGELQAMIAEYVFGNDVLAALMQLPGVNCLTAFATGAAVGDARRFPKASKLAAHGGFSPVLDTTGEEEGRAKKKGGAGKPLDGEGRRDLKFPYTEAGQAVLNACPGTPLGKWGWRLLRRGKPKNKAACAVGRKLLTYAWHVMRGDPTPNRTGEALFRRKLARLCSVPGKGRVAELGFASRQAFAEHHASRIYAGLPPAGPETAK